MRDRTESAARGARVFQFKDYQTPTSTVAETIPVPRNLGRPKKVKRKSQYELYPMPFFKVAKRGGRHSTWNVQTTGSYTRDYELGRTYAREFLASCDGSEGWCSLLSSITADMIRAGTNEVDGRGDPMVDGIVLGFMREIGIMLAAYTVTIAPPRPAS